MIILWDATTGQPRGKLDKLRSLFREVRHIPIEVSAAFSPDGSTLALAHDSGAIMLWNLAAGRFLGLPLSNEMGGARSVAFSPDGKTLAMGHFGQGTIALWDMATRTLQRQLQFPVEAKRSQALQGLVFSLDGRILAAHGDKAIILWDVASGQSLRQRFILHWDGLVSVAFSPDGKLLASGSRDASIMLWDVATRQPLGRIPTDRDLWGKNLAFSPDGKILATGGCSRVDSIHCRRGEIRLWEVATRQPLGVPLMGHPNDVDSVAFSPDDKILASGSEDTSIILWDVASRQPLGAPLTGHTASVRSMVFSPDGKTLASGSEDASIILWDVASRQPLGAPLTGHTASVSSVAFSQDGTVLASGSRDNTVLLWDIASRRPILRPPTGHTKPVKSVVFSPNGALLAFGAEDHSIILWDMSIHSWRSRACRIANRNLTSREWQQYIGNEPYRRTCAERPIHPSLVEAGRKMARAGNIEGAIALLGRAQELEPGLALDPSTEVKQLAASGLVEKGRQLARASNVEGAVTHFRRALELNPALALDPQAEAKQLGASALVQQGHSLLSAGDVDGAMALFQKALETDPHLDLDPKAEINKRAGKNP